MSPNCSFLEFLAYILEKSLKFGIFSSQNETEIMFFWGPIGIFGLISSVWDVFNRIQSYLEPGNLKSSFFGNFKFEPNFALFLASKNDYSHKSAIFSWKKPKWSKKDENMYKVYRKYKKNGFQNTLNRRKCSRFEALCPPCEMVGWKIYFFQKALHPTSKPLTCRQHWPRQPPCPSPHYLFCHQSIFSKGSPTEVSAAPIWALPNHRFDGT